MSNDLRNLKPEFKQILQNKDVISVNQDKHGKMARRLYNVWNNQVYIELDKLFFINFQKEWHQVWVKPVEPIVNGVWSHAVVYIDTNEIGDSHYVRLSSHKSLLN